MPSYYWKMVLDFLSFYKTRLIIYFLQMLQMGFDFHCAKSLLFSIYINKEKAYYTDLFLSVKNLFTQEIRNHEYKNYLRYKVYQEEKIAIVWK